MRTIEFYEVYLALQRFRLMPKASVRMFCTTVKKRLILFWRARALCDTATRRIPCARMISRILILIFHDISSDWNGQIGEISLTGQKLHRITNDLNVYSNSTLGVTRDGEQLRSEEHTSELQSL